MSAAGPVLLSPSLQRYAWGDPSFIPQLLGVDGSGPPCAEAWFGAHPKSPAFADWQGEVVPLDALVAERAASILGPELQARFGRLPYLLKVLAAAKPLSIQVHPNRAQAEAGFWREERAGLPVDAPDRTYRDPSDKPELLVALTPFDALCGFRSPDDIGARLESLPELAELLPPIDPTPDGLRRLLAAWFDRPEAEVQPALTRLVERLEARHRARSLAPEEPEHWALRAHQALGGPPDRGLLFVFLLELIHLEPGQGVFLPSGVPHSYLHGAGVELMVSSDNVSRAGLTSKHVDPAELLDIVRFDAGKPPTIEPVRDGSQFEMFYPAPSADIELSRTRLDAGQSVVRTASGPETLLVLGAGPNGRAELTHAAGRTALGAGKACLVPHGTEYRIRADGPVTVFGARVPAAAPVAEVSFRGRQPTRLAFGTSGLRGLVRDITDLEAYVDVRGFLDFSVAVGDAVPGTTVAIGGDLRPSTDGPDRSIKRAVARAVLDSGMKLVDAGCVPTPALMAYAIERGWPSIMVTGSHIPFDRNGMKFNKSSGEVLKSDEAEISRAIERRRRIEYGRDPSQSLFDDDGAFRHDVRVDRPNPSPEPARAYVHRYLDILPHDALAGLRVVVYEHSAAGRDLLVETLEGLGARVVRVGRSASFVAIDTEAIDESRLRSMQELANEAAREHGRIDAIVSTDGDGDRPLILGVDPAGQVRFYSGDLVGTVVAEYLDAGAAAVPISANDLIEDHLGARGVEVVRTRIGSPWVVAAMERLSGTRVVGWEANGGFLTGSDIRLERGVLRALPTRDAVLPIVAVLHAARRRSRSVVELFSALPRRSSRSGLLDAVPPEDSRALTSLLSLPAPEHGVRSVVLVEDEAETPYRDSSGQTRQADAAMAAKIPTIKSVLQRVFTSSRGFGRPVGIDFLDGIRIAFEGGDVAHVRPSGNAPQLRIYATAESDARAEAIVASALEEPTGLLRQLLGAASDWRSAEAIVANVLATDELFESGNPPGIIATVSGSEAARSFWQDRLDRVRPELGARAALSLHEDLPVNQAFGLLLSWKRIRPHIRPDEGALAAFVFGEGTRAAPLTEAECGQKPAITSFARARRNDRYLSTVEVALRHFAPVEAFLRRSGFDGLVVKWGDEVQIPTRSLRGTDERLAHADIVRFVSIRKITPDEAANKDWVGVDASGRITSFIPRRPIAEMSELADRGLVQRRGDELYGGINLGSVAMSSALLDVLLDEFEAEIADPTADRKKRPDLDPQLFTALTIAALPGPEERNRAWARARTESVALRALETNLPGVLDRLRRALDRFEARHGRSVEMFAMDFGDQYWGDIGQHRQMFDLYLTLRDDGPPGHVARAIAGIPGVRDRYGNRISGSTRLGERVHARNSVIVDADIEEGRIEDSVLIGTRCDRIEAHGALDLFSTALELRLEPRSASYKLVTEQPVVTHSGERVTTVFLPDRSWILRAHESTDLRDRIATYETPILGNPVAFGEAHARVLEADPADIERRRAARRAEVERHRGRHPTED